ncbi:MAG: hypothetical protein QX203_11240 [Methylococcaceae bacterium]
MQTVFEVYFEDGEEEDYPTIYFAAEDEAMKYVQDQVFSDIYTVVKFDTSASIIDALNGKLKQFNRTILLTT